MLKKILIGIIVVIAALAVYISTRPSDFRVSRSITLSAPAARVFEYVNDLHKWNEWSPWAKLDPNCKYDFEGPQAGKGAIFRWAGDNQVGEGSMTLTESRPNELVRYDLVFLKPMAGTSTAEFELKSEGDKTAVTWSMFGKSNFMAKAMSLVMDCDKMVGGQFEQGLANLKELVEAAPAPVMPASTSPAATTP